MEEKIKEKLDDGRYVLYPSYESTRAIQHHNLLYFMLTYEVPIHLPSHLLLAFIVLIKCGQFNVGFIR